MKEQKPATVYATEKNLSDLRIDAGERENQSSSPEASLQAQWERQRLTFAHRTAHDILGPSIYTSRTKPHEFWSTQPVPQNLDSILHGKTNISRKGPCDIGPINHGQGALSRDPIKIPNSDLEWVEFSFSSTGIETSDLLRIHDLLKDHYVENSENSYRFHYSSSFLKWALFPPYFVKDWYFGLRVRGSEKLIGFISALPSSLHIGAQEFHRPNEFAIINFLCIHKEYRKQKLAEILIQEVTRRVNIKGIFQALYTSGSVLPTPFARAQYFHRGLNVPKLLRLGFMEVMSSFRKFRNPESMMIRYHTLKNAGLPIYREMHTADVPQVRKLLNNYFRRHFAIAPQWENNEDVAHWFLPKPNVIYSYVIESPSNNGEKIPQITDFFSFYLLPSSLLDGSSEMLNAAYCFYFASSIHSKRNILQCALASAQQEGFDVFNVLNILDLDEKTLLDLKFNEGDGFLNYYLFNYRFPVVPSELVGLIML